MPRFPGLEPPLELAYGSNGSNGPQGMGWSLTSFSISAIFQRLY